MEAGGGVDARVMDVVRRVWGFDALRPLQSEAIGATLSGRDSLVVMPTGGGKSLCYQVPPMVTGRLCVVASPLIALMDDQVAGLELAGYPAAALHGHVSDADVAAVRKRCAAGELRLLFVAPERLLTAPFISWLKRLEEMGCGVESFAIDEAHCISQWGHDFRPEYRRLAELREHFPRAPLHAYTATATERVRADIVEQLGLRDPAVLVGRFDRPNLAYRIVPRVNLEKQAVEALKRHEGEAAIVYCISRKDTESLAMCLRGAGIDARAYHAGMDGEKRRRVQEDFKNERLDVVVATVAFGMGIDRGDVRLVLHAAMPKSIEHYQQETGRAGRDGLPAECVLLYSAQDAVRWRQLAERSSAEAETDDFEASQTALEAQIALVGEMQRLCAGARCRHKSLSEHFGQEYEAPSSTEPGCGACDVCLNELDEVEGATVIAQKILSCVARVGQAFGAAHVIAVLRGSASQKITERGHDRLSTYGLLRDEPKDVLAGYIGQLVDQDLLAIEPGQYPILKLTAASVEVMRGAREARLVRARAVDGHRERERGRRAAGVARGLGAAEQHVFEALRAERRSIAEEMGVPPYVVCGDDTLEEMARVRPGSEKALICVRGIGPRKLATFGGRLLNAVRAAALEQGLSLDAEQGSRPRRTQEELANRQARCPSEAARLFAAGRSVEDVCTVLGRAPSTVHGYLAAYLEQTGEPSIDAWVDKATRQAVENAIDSTGTGFLKPVFERLGGSVPYETIRVVAAWRRGAAKRK